MSDVLTFRDKLHLAFFEQKSEEIFLPAELTRVIRLRALFSYQLENPWTPKVKLIEWMMNENGIEKSQAYADAQLIESLLGNIRNANKTWIKYVVTQSALEAAQMAKDSKDLKGLTKALDILGKYNGLDKPDEFEFDDEKMYINFEPTDDIRVLSPNLNPISAAEKLRVKERLLRNTGITDAEFEELK